jgi:uncharacterized protein (TIGR02145 family)
MISKHRRISEPLLFIAITVFALTFNSCKKDPTIPVLSTDSATDITINSATLGGNITSDGGAAIIQRGVCWGKDDNPTTEGDHIDAGNGTGKFTSTADGLDPNTIYHVRAYAQNSVGIAYGNEVVFATAIAAPVITTAQVSSVTATTAVSGGVISYNGGAPITESGVCWSRDPQPDLDDSHVLNSTGATSFSSTLTNLSPGTKYYVRAYVKNSEWTVYGGQMTFNTKVADIEGNLYSTVTIGTQVWMAENLKTTKYNDDTPIPNITADEEWIVITSPAYCWFGNNISNKNIYGALYNWYVVGTGKLCPDGWHVPSDEEYKTLEKVLGMSTDQADLWNWRGTDQGSQMKSTSGWTEGGNGTNSSGFNGLAGGYRFGATGAFNALGILTYWWSSEHNADQGVYRRLDYDNNGVYRSVTSKRGGKYVRCIKN